MRTTVGDPIVWRLPLASPPERVFELLDTDQGRERFWAGEPVAPHRRGLRPRVCEWRRGKRRVVDRRPPRRMLIRYYGSEAEFELTPLDGGGCLFQVTCRCDDPAEWLEFYPGWVSWLLVLKAAADFDVDLRNGAPERTWEQRFVDQ